MPEWTPDRVVTTEVAATVVAAQLPELAGRPVRRLDAGWDNVVFLVGDDVVLRFVHREVAVPLAAREVAVLGALPELPLAVPRPRWVGTPTAEVPWPFWGGPLVPGRELAVVAPRDEDRVLLGAAVGTFLAALHRPEVAERVRRSAEADGVTLPVDVNRRTETAGVAERAGRRLDALAQAGFDVPSAARELLGSVSPEDRAPGPLVLVHGDLHARHVLLADDGTPTGVIDFGDTCLADPLVDLAFAYGALEGAARAAFWAAYGHDGRLGARETAARVLAVHMNAALLAQALADGQTAVAAETSRALHRATR